MSNDKKPVPPVEPMKEVTDLVTEYWTARAEQSLVVNDTNALPPGDQIRIATRALAAAKVDLAWERLKRRLEKGQ